MKKIRPPKPRRPRGFSDLADKPEDERIETIVSRLKDGDVIAVVVDDDPQKLERYLKKISKACGGQVEVQYSGPGPVAGTRMTKLKMVLG